MELWTILGFLLVTSFSQSYAYNIKISPKIHTQVTNLKNQGDNNSIQFSSITNSTILQATTKQVYDTHYNELLSTSAFLSILAVVFIILAVIINKLTLAIFKLSLAQSYSVRIQILGITIQCQCVSFSELF